MILFLLTTLIGLFGIVHILSELRGKIPLIVLFKPLTMVAIMGVEIHGSGGSWEMYSRIILVGLILSLAGDIFLMRPLNIFTPGLVFFLLAHMTYILAFTLEKGWQWSLQFGFPTVLFGIAILILLWPYLGKMKIPVIIYIFAIVAMTWQAFARWDNVETESALFAAVGSVFFCISDSSLAKRRFKGHFKYDQAFILGTYYLAQSLIAFSTI